VNDPLKISTPPDPGGDTTCPGQGPGEETADFGFRRVPAREKVGYVLKHFNSIAGKYDFMNTLLSLGLHYRWKRLSVDALRLKAGELVIDVCGGTADLSLLAARAVGPEGRVILCDINRAMIEKGRTKVERASLGGRILSVQGITLISDGHIRCRHGGLRDQELDPYGEGTCRDATDPQAGGKAGVPGVFPSRLRLVPPPLRFLFLPAHAPGREGAGRQPRSLSASPRIDPEVSPARTGGRSAEGDRVFRGVVPDAHGIAVIYTGVKP